MAAPNAGAGRDRVTDEREDLHQRACERTRAERWNARGRSRVVHPKYGEVVVPHSSNLAAVMNAAEYWGCDWNSITDAKVWLAEPEDGPVVMPREFLREGLPAPGNRTGDGKDLLL